MEFAKFEKISLKNHPDVNEKCVQKRIADDPGILGLGDVILKDKERLQPHTGRLDLLLQDTSSRLRYEVEIQLGAIDASHIIRTIEYWDIERKRYPQYDHVAVIVAEDVTSRFLNVVSLFNGTIPLMAIQMNALKHGDHIGLIFTTVLDQMSLGLVDDDEDTQEVTDRAYWESTASKETVAMADELLALAKQCDESLQLKLKYNKSYIALPKNGTSSIFIVLPQKKVSLFYPRLRKSQETAKNLENAGLDVNFDRFLGRYRIRLKPGEIEKNREVLAAIIKESYEASSGK